MKIQTAATLLLSFYSLAAVRGHGHEHGEGESMEDYARRHMAKEHHIDAFDLESFFAIHDLNSDGVLDASEIEAIYGVHHLESQKKSPDEAAHTAKAQRIVREVLSKMDKNRDGVLSPAEFVAAGFSGLPDFSSLGAEGHHYDEESEFFLHHEEMHHNTPETQKDESYTHPEDIEHFQNHDRIELEEENRERKFQGLKEINAEELKKIQEELDAALSRASASGTATGTPPQVTDVEIPDSGGMKVTYQRPPKRPDPKEHLKGAMQEASGKSAWGTGEEGYKRPKSPSEKLRKNVPYKYKFRRNWGDF